MNKVDFLIVGQGLAGTVLAHTLLKKAKEVLVIDEPSLSSCSRISAGMYNPVVIRRLTKSWMVDELLPVMRTFYEECGKLLGAELLADRDILKIFAEKAERDFWEKKRSEDVGKYMSAVSDGPMPELGETPFGHARVISAGHMNVQAFLSLSRDVFRKKGILIEERYRQEEIQHGAHAITYKDTEAGHVVLCEGHKSTIDPDFAFVPFAPVKGELLTVRIKNFPIGHTIHKGVSLTPLGNDLFRVGSTFAWDNLDDEPTRKAGEQLLEGVKRIVKREVEVVDHKAGIRPATKDRRPVLGKHPRHGRLAIFNGLGSKGVMLAPYFAGVLAGHLENNAPLPAEVDLDRFWKK